MNTTIGNPYIGPRTFRPDERELFFGRERETRELLSLLVSEQVILFYAQSGAGKSSLVNTSLSYEMMKRGYKILFGRVGGDAPAGLRVKNIFSFNLMRSLATEQADLAALAQQSLKDFFTVEDLRKKKKLHEDHLLVIDQFEELFTTHHEAWERRGEFLSELAGLVEGEESFKILIVMREDFIALLDPYSSLIPGKLRVRYYMQQLGIKAALKAIREPVVSKGFSRPYEEGVAEKLVDEIRKFTVVEPDGSKVKRYGQFVEPLILQVICYNVWKDLKTSGPTITEDNLQEIGDVNEYLKNYYARRVSDVAAAHKVSEKKIRRWFSEKLISPTGIRTMVLREPGRMSAGLENEVIASFSDFVRTEQRGGALFFELTHDRLVDLILDDNKRWEEENSSLLQEQAVKWAQNGYKDAWLLSSDALLEAEAWAKDNAGELTEEETDFLDSSRNFQHQTDERQAAERRDLENAQKLAEEQSRSARLARRGTVIAGVLAIAAVIALFWALYEQDISKDQQNQAQASELSVVASERSDSQLDLAMKLGLQADTFGLLADPQAGNDQARKAMLALLIKSNRYLKTVPSEEVISQIQFSPDGGKFASLDKNGVTLWDIDQAEPLNSIPINGHYSGVTAIAASEDVAIFASGSTNGTLILWDEESRTPLSEPFQSGDQRIYGLAISPDGKLLASSNYDGLGEVILWDISNPKLPVQVKERLSIKRAVNVITVAFSPDGKFLASGNSDGSIMLWDVTTRLPILDEPLQEHTDGVWSVAFSSDGETLASGSYDNSVILWDVSELPDPQTVQKISGPLYANTQVDFEVIAISPDGKRLAAGDDYGNITLWDISKPDDPTPLYKNEPLNGDTSWIISLAFSPDSNTLAAGSYFSTAPKLTLWDVKRGSQIGEAILDHKSSIWGLAFAKQGRELISASEDSTIRFWDVSDISKGGSVRADGKIEREDQHPGSPTSIAFSPDGRLLVSSGNDGTILLDAETQKQIGEGAILESPDKSIWVYQTLDEEKDEYAVHLMKSATDEPFAPPISGQDPFFSPDGRWLVYKTAGGNALRQLNIWDVRNQKDLGVKIDGSFLTFSPDGNIMLYQTLDLATGKTLLNVWDVVKTRPIQKNIDGAFQAFSPDSRFMVYQTYDDLDGPHFNLMDINASGETVYTDDVGGAYLTINPDTQTLVYQSTDARTSETLVNLYDISNSILVKSIPASDYRASSNGKFLVYITSEPETGNTLINTLDLETGSTSTIQGAVWRWSDNGNILLYSTFDQYGQTTNALNLLTGSVIQSISGTSFYDSAFLGGNFIYQISYSGGNNLVIVDQNGQSFGPFPGTLAGLTLTGNYLVYTTNDGLRIWDPLGRFSGIPPFKGSVLGTFNDGALLIYETEDGVHVWDLVKNEPVGEPFRGTYQGISPDGKILATSNEDNAIVLWDVARAGPLGEAVTPADDKVSSAALSPDGKTLAYADPLGIHLKNMEVEGTASLLANEHFGAVNAVYFSSDDKVMLTLGEDGNTLAWDLTTLAAISDPLPGTNPFFSKQNKYLVVFDGIDTTRVWNLETHALEGQPFIGRDLRLDFSSTDRYIWIYDKEQDQTTIMDTETHTPIGEPFEGQPNITFSVDDKFMTVFDYESASIKLWNLTNKKEVDTSIAASGASFSPNSKYLAVNDEGSKNVAVFELENMQQILSMPGQYFTFSPDGNFLEVADWENNTVTLTDLAAGSYIGEPLNGSRMGMWVDGNTLFWSVNVIDPVTEFSKSMVFLIDLAAHQLIGEPFEGNLVFDPNSSKLFAIIDTGRNLTTFWDANRHQPFETSINGSDYGFTYTADNIFIVHDMKTDQTTFWNAASYKQIGEALQGFYYYGYVNSPDGRIVSFQNANDSTPIFLDIETGERIGKSIDTNYDYLALCSGREGKVAVWQDSLNNSVEFWDMESDQSLGNFAMPENSYLYGIYMDPTCNAAAVSDGAKAETFLYDISAKKKITRQPIEGVSPVFNSDGTMLGISKDNITRFYSTANGAELDKNIPGIYYGSLGDGIALFQQYLPDVSAYISTVWDIDTFTQLGDTMAYLYYNYGPNNELVIYGSTGASVWNIDSDDPELLKSLAGHSSPITAMVFGRSGKKLASLASDGILLTDTLDGSGIRLDTGEYYGQFSPIMAFGQGGQGQDTFFTALGMDGSILTWDLTSISPKLLSVIDPPYRNPYQKTISPDGLYVVYVNSQSQLNIFDVLDKKLILDKPIELNTCCNFSVTFSPSGDAMFFNDGGKVYQWRRAEWGDPTSSPHEEATFGKDPISGMTIVMDPALPTSPKYLVATSGIDGSTQIWEWSKASRVGEPISGNIQVYGYNSETRVLYYGDGGGGLFRFSLDPADWHEALCEKAKQNLTQQEWSLFLPRLPYPTDPGEAACSSFPLDTIATETALP